MGEHNYILNMQGEIVGHFRFGVAWRKEPRVRLGEYYEGHVQANDRSKLANIVGSRVESPDGSELGVIETKRDKSGTHISENLATKYLRVRGKIVGECQGSHEAAAAGIVFFGRELYDNHS